MDSQRGTVDQAVDRLSIADSPVEPLEYRPGPAMARPSAFPVQGMSAVARVEPSDEAPAASLVGSLSVFALSDVLSMLSSTSQTGELQVVGESVDGRVWLDGGSLSSAQVGSAATIAQAVFDLACLTEGWFYFTSGAGLLEWSAAGAVDSVLSEVGPQVDEWKEIREVIPLEAVGHLAPRSARRDVQIRSDQWRVLTTVGNNGQKVRSVLDVIGGDQIVGLRTLRDLLRAGLIELDESGQPAVGARTVVRCPPRHRPGRRSLRRRSRRPGPGPVSLRRRRRRLRPGRTVRRPGRGGHHAASHRRRSVGPERDPDRPDDNGAA